MEGCDGAMVSSRRTSEEGSGLGPRPMPLRIQEFVAKRAHSFHERFCLEEASGALGDLGTLIPLLAGCAKLGSIRMGPAIFWMGVFNVISGIQWDIPMPVQPMKSIAAVAISDGLSEGAFAAAGVLTGMAVLLLGLTQTIDLANRIIPRCIIAGMQVGLGVRMAGQGCSYWNSHDWFHSVDCKLTFLASFLLTLVLMLRTRLPTALIVFSLGLLLALWRMLNEGSRFTFGSLQLDVIVPQGRDWLHGLLEGALPQLPLTALNSVVSVCALSVDLFGRPEEGGRGATRASVASSVGLMNLLGCWFGGMPSCHGAGGLAGQYRFGARGGMSIIMLGAVKIVLALSLGQTLNVLIESYPTTVLGVLLLFAGVELASVGFRSLRGQGGAEEELLPCFITAGAYMGTKNMALGVCAGLVASFVQGPDRCWESLAQLGQRRCSQQGPAQACGQPCGSGLSEACAEGEAERHDDGGPVAPDGFGTGSASNHVLPRNCCRSIAERLFGPAWL